MTAATAAADIHAFPYVAAVSASLQTVDLLLCSIHGYSRLTILSGLLLMLLCVTTTLAAERRYNAYHYAMYTFALLSSAQFGVVLCDHICHLYDVPPEFGVTRIVLLSLVFAFFLVWFSFDCAHQIVQAKSGVTVKNPQDAAEDVEDETKDADVVAI